MAVDGHMAISGERARRGIAIVTAVAAGAFALSGCGGSTKLTTCLSPRSVSDIYPGDPSAIQGHPDSWKTGILLDTVLPEGAEGLVVGFRPPNTDWKANQDSQPVSPERASVIAVRIGHDAVVFSTQIEAAAGSAACDHPPATVFGQPQPVQQILDKDYTFPTWG